jgi:biopolymer transport protein ExbB
MKYFHNLIIAGFLIPFLPLSAETELTKTSDIAFVDQKEEDSLTSLDEELSLLDEEFEEFKEELYSLENDLQKQERSLPSIPDNRVKAEKSQEEIIALKEENDRLFNTLTPEIETRDQILLKAELPTLGKKEAEHPFVESALVTKKNAIQTEIAAEFQLPTEQSKAVSDLPGIEIAEPVKELTMDTSKRLLIEKINTEKETLAEPVELMTDESLDNSIVIEKPDLIKESETTHLQIALSEEKLAEDTPVVLNVQESSLIEEPSPLNVDAIPVDLKQAFAGSPIIYSLLFAMSVVAVGIWLYSILLLRSSARISRSFIKNLQNKLNSNHFDEVLSLCKERDNLFCKMIASGIHCRRHGLPVMIEAMKAEGKRVTIAFWQKIGLLNDIAIIAPMLGLLGTVLGMFYAFYDVNRSIESISTLFDGLGISVGTTVAGLVVAILALILHSTAKYRLVRALTLVENEAQSVATLIDDRTSIYKG